MNKTKIVKLVLVGTSLSALSHATMAQNQAEQKQDSTAHAVHHSYGSGHANRWNYLLHRCDDGYHPLRVFRSQHYLNGQPITSQPHYHQKSLAAVQPSNSANNSTSSRVARGGFGSSASHSSSAAA